MLKATLIWLATAVFFLAALGGLWIGLGWFLPEHLAGTNASANNEAAGQIGDRFGAVNALFSGGAFLGVVIAILLQMRELRDSGSAQAEQMRLQTRQLEVLTDQIKVQSQQIETSQKIARAQSFAFLADFQYRMMLSAPQHRQASMRQRSLTSANRMIALMKELGETFPDDSGTGVTINTPREDAIEALKDTITAFVARVQNVPTTAENNYEWLSAAANLFSVTTQWIERRRNLCKLEQVNRLELFLDSIRGSMIPKAKPIVGPGIPEEAHRDFQNYMRQIRETGDMARRALEDFLSGDAHSH